MQHQTKKTNKPNGKPFVRPHGSVAQLPELDLHDMTDTRAHTLSRAHARTRTYSNGALKCATLSLYFGCFGWGGQATQNISINTMSERNYQLSLSPGIVIPAAQCRDLRRILRRRRTRRRRRSVCAFANAEIAFVRRAVRQFSEAWCVKSLLRNGPQ